MLNQDFFNNLYSDLHQAPNGKKFLDKYGIIDANDLMIKLTTFRSRKEMYMDLRKDYALHQMHKQQLDKFFKIPTVTSTVTEKKGTPRPRPFKEVKLAERIDFDEALNLRAIKVEIEDEIIQLRTEMEDEGDESKANYYGQQLNKLEDRLSKVKKQLDDYDMNEGVAKMTAKYDDAPELKGGQKRLPDMLQKAIVDKVVGKIKEAALTVNYDNPTQKDDVLNVDTAADATAAANTFKTSPSFKGTVKTDLGKTLVHKENLNEGFERDYEGQMAKSQLISIVKNAKELYDMMDNSTQLEGWVQSKLTKAEDYLSAIASYLEGQSITSTTPVVVAEEAVKDEEGSSLSVGDVVKAGDGGIYQVIYSYSEGKPFLVPFDLKKRKVSNLRSRIYFDSDSMITKKLHKVMPHSSTKGGFIK